VGAFRVRIVSAKESLSCCDASTYDTMRPHFTYSLFSWHPKLTLPYETGLVDMSNFVLSNGKGLVENRIPCYLCGQNVGMKVHCDQEGCRMTEAHLTSFHVTCARQAGFEVALREGEGDEIEFYGKLGIVTTFGIDLISTCICSALLSAWREFLQSQG
jgi:hypothetical protein